MAAPAGRVMRALVAGVERGYEGYVAKEEASAYAGGRTRRWLNAKVPGWTIGDERWTRRISVTATSSGPVRFVRGE